MARDIFRFHRISRHTMDRCVQIIGDYLEILKEYGTGSRLSVRLMISNIISEADNVDRVRQPACTWPTACGDAGLTTAR